MGRASQAHGARRVAGCRCLAQANGPGGQKGTTNRATGEDWESGAVSVYACCVHVSVRMPDKTLWCRERLLGRFVAVATATPGFPWGLCPLRWPARARGPCRAPRHFPAAPTLPRILAPPHSHCALPYLLRSVCHLRLRCCCRGQGRVASSARPRQFPPKNPLQGTQPPQWQCRAG